MTLALVGFLTFLINLPFGYWRSRTKKFSLNWFLAVHMSVPIIYVIRSYAGVEWQLTTFPILAGSYFLGQYIGSRFLRVAVARER